MSNIRVAVRVRVIAHEMRGMTLDETPSGNGGAADVERERGYRAGHNDATRAVVRRLDAFADALEREDERAGGGVG